MCGIIGSVSRAGAIDGSVIGTNVVTGLKRIQYRGYDSFGFAYIEKENRASGAKSLARATHRL